MKILMFKRPKVAVKFLLISSVLFLSVVLALYPDIYSKTTLDGVTLFAVSVMPSLLPYFFLTAILTKMNALSGAFYTLSPLSKKLFRLNGISFYVFFMSVLSGYPVGSKLIDDLYSSNAINESEASRMSLLCSTSGPLFIIGAVGATMFQSKTVGFILYLCHVLSAIITALLFKNAYGEPKGNFSMLNSKKCENFLYESVYSSVISVLIVGGFISVFYVISQILIDFNLLSPLIFIFKAILSPISYSGEEATAFTVGLIEFTKGAKMLSNIGVNPLTVSLTAFIITFSGVSVLLQSLAFLSRAKVNGLFFTLGKLVQAIIAFTLTYVSCLFFL